jgi:membrane-associated PAP2 superfamily phosphatase
LLALIFIEALEWDHPMALALIRGGAFPLKTSFVFQSVLHDWAKLVNWLLLGALISTWLRPWGIFRQVPRVRLGFAVLGFIACISVVALLKSQSDVSCPWDLREAGGQAVHVEHWMPWHTVPQTDGGPGKCFPGGHASGGFAWFALYFALLGLDERRARQVLWFALCWGCVLGLAQQLRGAHYFSHAPWSAFICWYLCTFMRWCSRARLAAAAPPASGAPPPAQSSSTT